MSAAREASRLRIWCRFHGRNATSATLSPLASGGWRIGSRIASGKQVRPVRAHDRRGSPAAATAARVAWVHLQSAKRPAYEGGPSHQWEGSGTHKGDLGLIPVPDRQFMQLAVVPKRKARQGRTEGPPDGVTAGLGTGRQVDGGHPVPQDQCRALIWVPKGTAAAAAVSDSERPAGVGGLSGPSDRRQARSGGVFHEQPGACRDVMKLRVVSQFEISAAPMKFEAERQ
ncbi:hypothetical protein ACMYR2_2367 [Nitrobacter sp. TKz-YC01]